MNNTLKKVCNAMTDGARDALRDAGVRYKNGDPNNGALILIDALLEAKVKPEEIVFLTHKYYGLEENDAENILICERNIYMPCKALEEYLVYNENYSRERAHKYIVQMGIPPLLEENNEYFKLKPAELLQKAMQKMVNPPIK